MKNLFLIIILAGLSSWSFGQSLEDYLQEAAENNPELNARFNEYLASLEQVPQIGALPDPEFTFGYFIKPMELLMGNQRAQISLMQMFPWFGMLRNQRNEASLMARAKYEAFREAKNQLYFEVKDAWYQLYRLQGEIAITEENLQILRSIERMAVIRFQSGGDSGAGTGNVPGSNRPSSTGPSALSPSGMSGGNMKNMRQQPSQLSQGNGASGNMNMGNTAMPSTGPAMADVLRIQIEIKELENQIASLRDNQVPLRVRFNTLLNRAKDEEIIVADTILPLKITSAQMELTSSVLERHPMTMMLEAEREAYEVQQDMARLEGRPMFGIGLNYMIFSPRNNGSEMAMGGDNMFMPMVSLSLPIYRKQYKARIKEAELNQGARLLQKESTYDELTVQWEESLKDLRDIERRVVLYEEQNQLADQALNIMIASYAANGSSFEEILRVQQQLLEYKLKLLNAIVSQNAIIASLNRISASELE